jgi:photosystem II stability/assembly factor-like uncharacterized protein
MSIIIVISVVTAIVAALAAIIWVLWGGGPAPEPQVTGICSADGWCWQNPRPHGQSLRRIYFFNDQDGMIIGFKGIVYRTTDGGTTWDKTEPPVEGIELEFPLRGYWFYDCWDFLDIHFLSKDVGWAVGDHGAILRTNDSANTWMSTHEISYASDVPHFQSVFFTQLDEGWVAGYRGQSSNREPVLKHTSNYGQTWESQDTNLDAGSLFGITFVQDALGVVGWAVGSGGTIIRSYDEGDTWQLLDSGSGVWDLHAVSFIDRQRGWVVGAGVILGTTNGGDSWEVLKQGEWSLLDVAFRDERTVLAVGANRLIFLTINHGQDWIQVDVDDILDDEGSTSFRNVIFRDSSAWIVGSSGCLLHSEDSGIHWTSKSSNGPHHYLKHVRFVDTSNGWALSNELIMHTTDGGTHWSEQFPLAALDCQEAILIAMSFVDSEYGWAVCWCIMRDESRVTKALHTNNGGTTWSEQYSAEYDVTLDSVWFLNRDKGWMSARRETDKSTLILHTADGGESWTEQYSGTFLGGTLYEYLWLNFVNENHGWLVPCRKSNRFLFTIDGGNTWMEGDISALSIIEVVSFANPNQGWVFGRSQGPEYFAGMLYHTDDGGVTWTNIDYETRWAPDTPPECIPSIMSLTSMVFIDENNGVVCGYDGEIFYTSNGGVTWMHQRTGTHQILKSINSVGTGSKWAVGHRGVILHKEETG